MGKRGDERLLRDVQAVGRMLDLHRPSADERLRSLLGAALADRLRSPSRPESTRCSPIGPAEAGREIA